ncbi:MAG: radical SAM protein [Sulfolobus sp.]
MVLAFRIMRKFTVISITGGSCSLNCFYCTAKYINSMEPALTPETLKKKIESLYQRGVRGFLISGGFNEKGELPIKPFISTLRELKRKYEDIVFNIHPGLLDLQTIEELSDVVDIVDYEFAYSPKAFYSKGLKERKREDYIKTLEWLIDRGPKYVVPHIMLGLPNDDPYKAIEIIATYKPYLLNFLVFIPTKGTPSERVKNPSLDEVLELMRFGSRLMNGKVSLGCMRPFSLKQELDRIVIKEGIVERIANPANNVVKEFSLKLYDACCSLPEELLPKFKLE